MITSALVLNEPGRSCQAENEETQAKLASKEETSKLDLAIISRASTSVATKLVTGIQCNPDMVLDVNKLPLHHAIGKEATTHLRGKNIGLLLSANPGANTIVKWFWLCVIGTSQQVTTLC